MELKPGYQLTEVGVIPADWKTHALGEGVRLLSGHHVLAHNCNIQGVGVPYITGPADFSGGVIRNTKFTEKPTTICQENDILVTVKGSGSGSMVRSNGAYCISRQLMAIRTMIWDSEFIFEILHQDAALLGATATGLIPGLSRGDILNKVIAIPPLPEQRAIATALSDVDALLAKLDQLLAKKRNLKQAAMQELLTGKRRLPGFVGEWEEKRLGELAAMGSGGTPPSTVPGYYDGDIPWVSISDMTKAGKFIFATDRNLSGAGFANSAAQMFPAGTILYAMYASLGECSIAGIELCSSQAILGIQTKPNLSNEFLYHYLASIKNTVKGMGQQGTQSNLNKGMVQAFQLRLPKIQEQEAIASVLSTMDAELTALEARREKVRAVKQGMMQELLTGRIRLV